MSEKIFSYLEVHAVDHCNNNCRWCNNHSPFCPEREYAAGEYIPWMEKLEKKGIEYDMISVMGGEPFLHKNLTGFVLELRRRFPRKSLAISTNGFWLGEEQIESYQMLWKLTDILFISLYPNLLRGLKDGGDVTPLLHKITKHNPHLKIDLRQKQTFRMIAYSEEPVEPNTFCGTSECTTLLADGRLARCGLGGYAGYSPDVGEAFRSSKHMFFDLNRKFSKGEFWNWRRRWPFDACYHCDSYKWRETNWKAEKGKRRRLDLELEHDRLAGGRLMALGNFTQAESLFRRTSEKYPLDAALCNDLAVCVSHREPLEALAYLAKALEIDPDHDDARANLRRLRHVLGRGTENARPEVCSADAGVR